MQTPRNEIVPGVVTDKVVVQSDPDQSYAIYLPASYSSTQKWPIIFCFDPGARGKFAVEHLKAAAEKFGYLVVCSNNSRNGLDGEVVTKIVTAFWRDVHDRFSIDEQRTYFAGFSGGARLVVGLANRCNGCVAGVFVCGAGYPGGQQPTSKTAFSFAGAIGYDDFNFGELRTLEDKFDQLTTPHRFYQFQGGHEWPPESVSERALAWFNLQAMKRGALAKDEKFFDERFAADVNEGDRLLAADQLIEARTAYASTTLDFEQLRDTSSVMKKLAELRSSSDLKKQLQLESEVIRRQQKEVYEIGALWMKPRLPDEDLTSRAEAKSRIRDWAKKKDALEDSRDRRLARRILTNLRIGAYENAREAVRSNSFQVAVANMELVRAIEPEAPGAAYELARTLSLNSQKRAALDALEEAVRLGFKDLERLRADPAFAALANDPRFQKLANPNR